MFATVMQIQLNPWWVILILICAIVLAVVLALAVGFGLGEWGGEFWDADTAQVVAALVTFAVTVVPIFLLLIWLFNGPPPARIPG